MSALAIPRTAGIALLTYAVGTFAAFMFAGAPGGAYYDERVQAYVTHGQSTSLALWYVAALSALALVVFGTGLRRLPLVGGPLAALAAIGAALSVTGSWLAGGVLVGMLEGGSTVQTQTSQAVVYLITEIGNAMAVCGPAMCVGVIAITLAVRGPLPTWLRVASVIGGICGILAPFFFTYFIYLLWALAMSVTLIAAPAVRDARQPAPSLV